MLNIHRAERADALAGALANLLADPPADPFAPELVGVPTRGMERWLTQQLSNRLGASGARADGVCANVCFPFPSVMVGQALARASGVDPELDPWRPGRTVWPLLRVIERSVAEPWLSCLAEHIGASAEASDPRRERRLSTVRRVADLFDRYHVHRPEMVRRWATGEDRDGSGARLGADAVWQPRLWRGLRDEVGAPSPAERLQPACERLRADPSITDLPERLSLFGITRLPGSFLDVLAAIAVAREVHLFVLHPSPTLWQHVNALLAAARAAAAATAGSGGRPRGRRRAEDPTADLPVNRLLASWGQDARELQLVLQDAGATDHHHPADRTPASLLGLLQAGVRADAPAGSLPLSGEPPPVLETHDRSVQVHACHGRARQVEVLRDAILHLLEEDPTLEPRDVIVMCPDVETYAPLIQATYAAGSTLPVDETSGEAGLDLRVRLADRSLRETNPLLSLVSALLELPRSRLTASQVLDLADRQPLRRRFGFADEDLARVRSWVEESGVRWGFDAPHRAGFRLDKVEEGTWATGLGRLLLGVAMADESLLFEGVLPLDDVGSSEIDLAGRLCEFVARLGRAIDALSGRQPPAAWRESISNSVASLATVEDRAGWQQAELQRVLDETLGEAAVSGSPDLALAEVRALLSERLAGRPTRANFRTGHLTVCTLVPMRAVPHRVVCLLGLDDGSFPRRSPRDGDDLTRADPLLGDRDPRIEDRQMLLDALMAAKERLIITYTGADERTNLRRPPAVPLGELLDEIDAVARPAPGCVRVRDQVLTEHPLQPFDPRNFEGEHPWSFDAVSLGGARSLRSARRQPPPLSP